VYSFADPLPAGAKITRVDLTFSAVDQGWGGTGSWLGCYISGNYIGSAQLWHSTNSYALTSYGPFPNYVNGGLNNFSMYFVGWSGWQAFMYGGYMVLSYG
jgi:hypothetical protein